MAADTTGRLKGLKMDEEDEDEDVAWIIFINSQDLLWVNNTRQPLARLSQPSLISVWNCRIYP